MLRWWNIRWYWKLLVALPIALSLGLWLQYHPEQVVWIAWVSIVIIAGRIYWRHYGEYWKGKRNEN